MSYVVLGGGSVNGLRVFNTETLATKTMSKSELDALPNVEYDIVSKSIGRPMELLFGSIIEANNYIKLLDNLEILICNRDNVVHLNLFGKHMYIVAERTRDERMCVLSYNGNRLVRRRSGSALACDLGRPVAFDYHNEVFYIDIFSGVTVAIQNGVFAGVESDILDIPKSLMGLDNLPDLKTDLKSRAACLKLVGVI